MVRQTQSVAIIGAGFYGCHIALQLAKRDVAVTVFDRHEAIMSGTSGTYGIRVHKGPHYPRSPATRQGCRQAFDKFMALYPQLVAELDHSLYALGATDDENLPPRVSRDAFEKICKECDLCEEVDPAEHGLHNLLGLWNVHEPVLLRKRAREFFAEALAKQENIRVMLNTHVKAIETVGEGDAAVALVDGAEFDWVVNCTYFKSFSQQSVAGASVFFQPCLTLVYEDSRSNPDDKPFMLTVMDGWFPCLMPMLSGVDEDRGRKHQYLLYHAKYTILGNYRDYADCRRHLESVTADWVLKTVRPQMERATEKFVPDFRSRFRYTGYLLETATKLRTETEFRRSLVWNDARVIHVFSGRLSENTLAADMVEQTIFHGCCEGKQCAFNKDALRELGTTAHVGTTACDMGVHKW